MATVGNVEASIESRESVGEDDDDLYDVAEAVVTCFAVIPGWIVRGPQLEGYASPESSTERKQYSCEDKKLDFCSHAALSEFVHWCSSGDNEARSDNGQWEKSENGKKRAAGELNVAKLLFRMWVQSVEVIYHSCN